MKTDGDSVITSYTAPSAALECAIDLQRSFAEPIEEEGNFFGSAVILGARIKDQAGGGEILVPEAVRHMLSGKSFVFHDRGQFVVNGFEDAVRLYEVWWRKDT